MGEIEIKKRNWGDEDKETKKERERKHSLSTRPLLLLAL